ncbi:hypothetical protein TTHERM_00557890 (macronuclear) [Tetrahymena thermophila SB210]|uniref:Uncharacterized protein n=1 Tax=Tetrahymena thermophila (strain SB210) TaxID=312017 RepID=I7MGW6_TETTS|nr:hypothetical protein TTHERM_00557890 [Tetrahymena thermophila SB210]EAS02108.2 hypothetical protein TTHERM_00557890 [Tetrahymena thermophila SB210]|eukprot:XP_001022353.2 hypothetical protein TTHERM_00557890 [Tetrahymena thermophila SB210]
MIRPDQNRQLSNDQRGRNVQNNQQKQNTFQQNIMESNQAQEYDSQMDLQKQQQLQLMRDQLQFKYKNILDNYYSQKIKLNEQVQKEFNELSQILEMPMESLISAIRNIQCQQSPTLEKQKVPHFLREIVVQDVDQQNNLLQSNKQEEPQNQLAQSSQNQSQQNIQISKFEQGDKFSIQSNNQLQTGIKINEEKDNYSFNQQQQQQQQQNAFQQNSVGNSQKSSQYLQNSASFSQKQMGYNNNRFLSDNPELMIGGDQIQQYADQNNNKEDLFPSKTNDILQESQEFFSKASQSKQNFFLHGFEEIDQLIQQNKESKISENQLQKERIDLPYKELNSKQSNEQRNQGQNVQMAPSSLQIIKQLQISPFSQMRQSYEQQSYAQQNQKRKEQLGRRYNTNSSRDEQTLMELNKIQQTQQLRDDSEETRQQNKQLRVLQLLSKSSPERQYQFIQEKQRYLQNEDFNERGIRQSSKDSDNSDNFALSKKIINLQPTNSLSPEQTIQSFQESPINYKSPKGYLALNEEFSKSISSQKSPLNLSKSAFQFPQSTKSVAEKSQQQQQFFSQQKKTLQLIESHQELDELRKNIEDLNIEICNKDLEIIDLSTKLRDYKNQQLNLALKSQKEQKEFDSVKLSLLETKNYLNSQIKEYLQVLQEIQACENSTYSIKSKAAKQVRNSQLLTEKNLQSALKSSARLSKGEVSVLDKLNNSKDEVNLKIEIQNKTKLGGMPSSSTFSDSKANNNKSILEDEEEDQLSEQQSIDLNKNSLEQDEIISNQILEENESYFMQYIQTQKLLNQRLASLQINEPHKIKIQQFQQDIQSLKQENQRLQEQINQMSGILSGINSMEQQQKDIDQYLEKLDQEKKSLELTLDEFNRRVSKKKSELSKAKEQLYQQLNQIKSKKEETALEHNQIISKNQIQIQELQKKKNQLNQKLEAELNQMRKELRSKVSLNNFEKTNLENDIKKKQEVLNLFAQKQQVSIKPQTEKLQQELQILQQTNKLLKKDIQNKKIQLENTLEENDDFEEIDDQNLDSSDYQNELLKEKLIQKKLKQELKQQKEKLEQEKSFSNAQNEEFVIQTEQKLKYHNGLKAQISKLQQELEQLQTKRDQCLQVQQNIELTINNSKGDINSHEQLSKEIKQVQESNQIIKNKINQLNTVLLSKKSLAAKQEDEINKQLKDSLQESIMQMSDLNMQEQDLIQQRKELKNQLQN